MMPCAVVVIHRSAMVAEGLAAALARYPWIAPVGAGTAIEEGESPGVDAVALDRTLPGAERLRRRGVRVVLLGEEEGDGVAVSLHRPVAALAAALAPDRGPPRKDPLTARQREILTLVGRGLAGKQVALRLGISPKTVERHKTRIFERLGVANQTAACVAVGIGGGNAWSQSSI